MGQIDEKQEYIWEYRGIATQPVGAPASMGFLVAFEVGMRAQIMQWMLQAQDYASGRVITLTVTRDSSGAAQFIVLMNQSQDLLAAFGGNTKTSASTVTAITDDNIGIPINYLLVGGDDELNVLGASLVNTEKIDLYLKMKLTGLVRSLPTVTPIGASVTISTESNKLI